MQLNLVNNLQASLDFSIQSIYICTIYIELQFTCTWSGPNQRQSLKVIWGAVKKTREYCGPLGVLCYNSIVYIFFFRVVWAGKSVNAQTRFWRENSCWVIKSQKGSYCAKKIFCRSVSDFITCIHGNRIELPQSQMYSFKKKIFFLHFTHPY